MKMKMKTINQIAAMFVIWFFILGGDRSAFAADTVSAKYFPLAVGNSYTYLTVNNFFQQYRSKATITKDTIINNKKYFYCYNFPIFMPGWIRYDSARSNLLKYNPNQSCSNYIQEVIVDSLAMSVNNSINCFFESISLRKCTAIGNQLVFGETRNTKSFLHDGIIYSNLTYASGVGIVSYCSGEPPPCESYTNLIGCVINGVTYGDTLLTGIEQSNSNIPDKFFLAQNYPNPFNPETIISFTIPKNSFVSLKIFNILGRETEKLVNEVLKPGFYNYKWNGQNVPSGIYYYKIVTDNFSETRKMILVK